MGPQLGYYYPEIVQQIDLHGPGIKAQGVGVPGLAMYILIGRTQDYAWSLTSAGHDVRDVFAEQLCEPDGSTPTRASTTTCSRASAGAMETFNAGTLGSDAAHLQPLGARPGVRDRDGRRQALRALRDAARPSAATGSTWPR